MDLKFDKLRQEHIEIISRLTRAMANISDEEEILHTILRQLMQETGAEIGAFIAYDEDRDTFEPRTVKTDSSFKEDSVNFSQTVFRKVLETKEAVLSFDTQTDEDYAGRRSVIINRILAILAFPLIINGTLYGILYLDSRRNRKQFNEASRQFLSFFAPIASLTLEQIISKQQIEHENIVLRSQLDSAPEIPSMIGNDPKMQKLFLLIKKVAPSDASILITGENGTGKDLVARAIHDLSRRKEAPYIAQYIGNIPASILESELFGYKKGAFTGANNDKTGLFEAVSQGTLFMDEIGDLSPELQTKLLRVLQNKEIKRLGENIVRKVDVRIIAATNQNLTELVKEGRFREDLYYRLNVINIHIPALRERKSDIPLLAEYFIRLENPDSPKKISKSAMSKLIRYHWPGNVRQLENMIKRVSILAAGDLIEADDIEFDDSDSDFTGTLEDYKNLLIKKRLEECNGNRTLAAKSLGISLRSLQEKAKALGL